MNFITRSTTEYCRDKNKFYFCKRNIFFIVSEIISLILLFYGRAFYIKSLFGCDGNEFECVVINIKYIFEDIKYCLKSILYFWIFLIFVQLKLCSKYILIIFFLIIFELILKDRGDSFLHHGIFNLSALFFLLTLGEILILLFIIIINIKNIKCSIIIIMNLALLLLILCNKNKDKYFCKNWDRSLNNSFISNNETLYPCLIVIPNKRCLIDILSPLFDFSKLFNIKCENRKEKEKYLLKSFSNLNSTIEIKKIGFPLTKIDKAEIKGQSPLYGKKLFHFVMNNLINLDEKNISNIQKQNNQPEIIIDFTENKNGEIKQTINFNKDLSEKRLKFSKDISSNNILFLFFDNLSRVHFYRQYKKTSKFIRNFLSFRGYSTEYNLNQKYHGFEFLKYHKFKGSTWHNVMPMFSGVYFNKRNKMISIVRDMKNLGYITCNVQDVCHKELMDIGYLKTYYYIEFDHEYSAPSCDPNIYKIGYGLFSGENGILRKCLYGKESIEHAFQYGKLFWKSYKNNKKFLRIVNTYGHEYSGEKSKYADNALYDFLLDLYRSEQLNNTTLFFVGDHGNLLMGAYQIFEPNDIKIEKYFPIFIIITPDKNNISFNEQYSEIIKNQQTLVTPFDIYFTLRDIIYGNKYKDSLRKEQINNGESLFKYINPKMRTCNKYQHMKECFCQIKK